MATKRLKIPDEIQEALMRAVDLAYTIEMANIPEACWESAAASYMAVERKLQCWVVMQLNGSKPDMKYDLRFGHEATAE